MDPDHIPFSSSDEQQVRSLTNWMGAVGVAHVLGAILFGLYCLLMVVAGLGLLELSTVAGGAALLQGVVLSVLTLLMLAEAGLIFGARGQFVSAADNFERARTSIANGMRRLRYLFMCEVVWFAGSAFLAILQVVVFYATPDSASVGEQMGDLIRQWGGQ